MNRRAVGCLFEAAETLVLTLVIFLLIQNFVAQPYKVEQQSMEDTLQPGQYVLVDKLTPRFDPYKRGDIVVFTPPGGSDSSTIPFIKRVIGLGGDTVDILDGHVRINGQELREPYVFPGQTTQPTGGLTHYVVPEGDLFVMGDHRENSSDSRVFGPIPTSTIIGRAWLRYWPIDTFSVLATPTYPILSPLVPSPGPSTGTARAPSRAAAVRPAAAG